MRWDRKLWAVQYTPKNGAPFFLSNRWGTPEPRCADGESTHLRSFTTRDAARKWRDTFQSSQLPSMGWQGRFVVIRVRETVWRAK